nr:hypothetical protein [Tanacetum cinerariifolium]
MAATAATQPAHHYTATTFHSGGQQPQPQGDICLGCRIDTARRGGAAGSAATIRACLFRGTAATIRAAFGSGISTKVRLVLVVIAGRYNEDLECVWFARINFRERLVISSTDLGVFGCAMLPVDYRVRLVGDVARKSVFG